MMFDHSQNLAGMIDMLYLCYDPITGKWGIVMVDWKNYRAVYEESPFGLFMYPPHFSHLPATNLTKAHFQTGIYKRNFLEKKYGLPIFAMYLAVFHENQADYRVYPMEDLEPEVTKAMRLLHH